MHNILIFLVLTIAQPPPEVGIGGGVAPEPVYQKEPRPEVPPPLMELKAQKERVETGLRDIRQELAAPVRRFHHLAGSGGPMAGPWRRQQAARWLGEHHGILTRAHELQREHERIIAEAWEVYERLRRGEEPDSPFGPEQEQRLRRWMVDAFGPPPSTPGIPPGGPAPWEGPESKRGSPRAEGLLRRLQRLEKRLEQLEATVARQQEEIERLRAELEAGAPPPRE